MGFIKDFREFAMRGNVIDLAVGVIIGGAFGKIVSSIVEDIIMPLIGLLAGKVNFADLYIPLKGQPLGLPLDAAKKLGAVILETCVLAQYLKQCVDREPALELLAPVALNIVCFRYRCQNADDVNQNIVADLQESGIAAPSTTTIDGRLAIRAAIVNHRTNRSDIDALIKATIAFGSSITNYEHTLVGSRLCER